MPPLIPGSQWGSEAQTCPWQLQRGATLYRCGTPGTTHTVHFSDGPVPVSWREGEVGAYSVTSNPEQVDRMAIRVAPLDLCDNRQCPNKAHEGTMTVTTVFTTPVGGKRDITLLLCAPCAEYLSLVVRQ